MFFNITGETNKIGFRLFPSVHLFPSAHLKRLCLIVRMFQSTGSLQRMVVFVGRIEFRLGILLTSKVCEWDADLGLSIEVGFEFLF